MRSVVECRLVTASERVYTGRDGLEKTYRDLWVASGDLSVAPDQVRVPDASDAALDAFDTLLTLDQFDPVTLVLDIEGFGREKSMTITLHGIAA